MNKSVDDILQRFREIDGFQAVGVYAPSGKMLSSLNLSEKYMLDKVGLLTNAVLLNTQKAATEMHVGKGKRTIITTNEATIITQSFNESSHLLKSAEGNGQFNIIAIFKLDVQLGVTKMKMDKIIYDIAPLIPNKL